MGPASQAYKRLLALASAPDPARPGPSGGWHTPMPPRTSWSPHAHLSPTPPAVSPDPDRRRGTGDAPRRPRDFGTRPPPLGPDRRRSPPTARAVSPDEEVATPGSEHSDGASRRGAGHASGASYQPYFPRGRDEAQPARPRIGQPRWSVDMGHPPSGSATSPTSCSPRLTREWSPSSSTAGACDGSTAQGSRGRPTAGRTHSPAPSPPAISKAAGSCSTISRSSAAACSSSGAKGGRGLDGDRGRSTGRTPRAAPRSIPSCRSARNGRVPGPLARPDPRPRHRQRYRSLGPPWPTRGLWSVRRCRSTRITCWWSRIAGRSVRPPPGAFAWDFRECREMPVFGPASTALGERRAAPGDPRHSAIRVIGFNSATGDKALVRTRSGSRT